MFPKCSLHFRFSDQKPVYFNFSNDKSFGNSPSLLKRDIKPKKDLWVLRIGGGQDPH
jgi:hypothetical protein